MRAVKGNKEYSITEANQKSYQDMGFDILDDDGEIVAYGRGNTVPYGAYMTLKAENKQLKDELEVLSKVPKAEDVEDPASDTVSDSVKKPAAKKASE